MLPAPLEEAEDHESGRKLFAGSCEFLRGVMTLADLPPADYPEVAFAGRSNVGKSSLVNALTGRTTLARVSNTPGRTQQLNFFLLGGRLTLVDLPGYGYAQVEKAKVKAWQSMLRSYLRGRAALKRVLLLVDARHGVKPNDADIMDMLDLTAVSYLTVLTKADKLAPAEREAAYAQTAQAIAKRPAAYPAFAVTSAETGEGIAALRAHIAALA